MDSRIFVAAVFLCSFFSSINAFSANTLLYSDSFEQGFGNWLNETGNDNKQWLRDSAGTPSSGTGPATGAGGSTYYVYFETSSGYAFNAGDSAILLGPVLTETDINLSFQYHMYGPDTGTLAVDVLTAGGWINDVWVMSGQQQTSNAQAYANASVDLSAYTVSRIRFRATAIGNYRGDLALDNIEIYSIPSGPSAPEFLSNPLQKSQAYQNQPYGDSIAADAVDANGDPLVFSKVSGPLWLQISADGTLSGTPSAADIGTNNFVVQVSDGGLTSSADLIIQVEDGSAPVLLDLADFETGMGQWTNDTAQDNKNWTRYSGATSSSNTGPSGGSNSTYYVYLETSSGSAYTAGDTANLLSPVLNNETVQITFDYHMYGSNMGTLALDVYTNGTWVNDVWRVSGQQSVSSATLYSQALVDLSGYAVAQLRFRATAVGGFMGDMALDNIAIWKIPAGPVAPVFNADPIIKNNAVEGLPYAGSLSADASDANNDPLIFSKNSGPAWLMVDSNGELSGVPTQSDIGTNSFIIDVSDGALSSTATLQIDVLDSAVPVVLSSTDFESGLGDWSNTTVGDNKDWTRDSAGTPSSGTGPQSGASGSTFYVYLETSSGSAYTLGDTAILEGPVLTGFDLHLQFDYHMYGINIGTLAVDVLVNGSWMNSVWELSGQQQTSNTAAYGHADVDLSAYNVSRIRFRATAAGNYQGDMALDNITIIGSNGLPVDTDGDGVPDVSDDFPSDPGEWLDSDQDNIGNNADTDDDNDGYLDTADAFPLDPSEWLDTDSDGIGNNTDTDDDNDGVADASDAFPLDPSESFDTDNDGLGNNADTDDDNDGVLDTEDAFPMDASETADTDGDGLGNNVDSDDDGDGTRDLDDAFPLDASEWSDYDLDGIGNNADTDDDNDGVEDALDAFPRDSNEWEDSDADGVGDNTDPFPLDPTLPKFVHAKLLYEFSGTGAYQDFGTSVSGHGDLNGDGVADILIGAEQETSNSTNGFVQAYSGATGALLYTLTGNYGGEDFGRSVKIIADVNGDGYDDFAVGAPGDCLNGTDVGRATVYSGQNASELYTVQGEASADCFGHVVNAIKDLNGDGVADILVGTASARHVKVLSGKNGAGLFSLQASTSGKAVGTEVADAGDINNDGVNDIIAAAADWNYVEVFSGVDGSSIRVWTGTNAFGAALAKTGDVDNDGFADVAIAEPSHYSPYTQSGRVLVYSGQTGYQIREYRGRSIYENYGTALDQYDVNGDGVLDLLIGTAGTSLRDGRIEILSGADGASISNVALGSNGDEFGSAVSFVGDLNGDGRADIIVGAPEKTLAGISYTGAVYVIVTAMDSDGDGIADIDDALPLDPNETVDSDGDGVGDNGDAFPNDPAEAYDTDGDTIGNNADVDDDNDGVEDSQDAFPLDAAEWMDSDSDGVGDNADQLPLDPTETKDTDQDGIGNNADLDDDNDGLSDAQEIVLGLSPIHSDTDGDLMADGNDPYPFVARYQIVAGGYQNCALDDNGVHCWGNTNYGQDQIPSLVNPRQVASDYFNVCALDDNGVVCWGGNSQTVTANTPTAWTDPKEIGVGYGYACAIDDDDVICWGSNYYNQMSNAPTGLSNPRNLSVGESAACVIDDYGLHCWGNAAVANLTVPTLINPFDVAVGDLHVCALDQNGLHCWGNNQNGEIDVPSTVVNPRQVVAGEVHACVLDDVGTICWGWNSWGQVTNVTQAQNTVQISASNHTTCILQPHAANCWGYSSAGTELIVPEDLVFFGGIYNPDNDGDGVQDSDDAFPNDASEWLDSDGDGIGNNADPDDDNDGVLDVDDAYSLDPTEWLDTDGDGIGNNLDANDDNDLFVDSMDAFPLDASEWSDTDGDGVGDVADPFPLSANAVDGDNDGMDDNWELAHNLDIYSDDSLLDADGDLYSNLQEFKAGSDPNDAMSPHLVKVNDTGLLLCSDYAYGSGQPNHNDELSCMNPVDGDGDPIPLGQDGHSGRDVTHNDDADGFAGFSFTKLDSAGNDLPSSATSWTCVRDNVTGNIWEAKSDSGRHSATNTYTWYNPDSLTNGGNSGAANGGACSGSSCDTQSYISAANSAGLCGLSNWKLPTRAQLFELVKVTSSSVVQANIDLAVFPKTQWWSSDWYWTSSSSASGSAAAWGVSFYNGRSTTYVKSAPGFIRLISTQ